MKLLTHENIQYLTFFDSIFNYNILQNTLQESYEFSEVISKLAVVLIAKNENRRTSRNDRNSTDQNHTDKHNQKS